MSDFTALKLKNACIVSVLSILKSIIPLILCLHYEQLMEDFIVYTGMITHIIRLYPCFELETLLSLRCIDQVYPLLFAVFLLLSIPILYSSLCLSSLSQLARTALHISGVQSCISPAPYPPTFVPALSSLWEPFASLSAQIFESQLCVLCVGQGLSLKLQITQSCNVIKACVSLALHCLIHFKVLIASFTVYLAPLHASGLGKH